MFFCDWCATRNDWTPVTVPIMGLLPDLMRSVGPCEICRAVVPCWDIPSKALPFRPVYVVPETP